jgi:hypothetical protein
MYRALWRILPGPAWLRVLLLMILAVAVVAALMVWVFPVIDGIVQPEDVTVGTSG